MSQKYQSPFTPEQEEFIRDNCTALYVKDIASELGLTYTPVYNYIRQNNLKQKKVMKPQVRERRVQWRAKKSKVIDGCFNVNARLNWVI